MDQTAIDWDAVIDSPLGRIGLLSESGALTSVDFLSADAPLTAPRGDVGRLAVEQLRAYFADPRVAFDLPLAMGGTPFQRRVWAAMTAIPAGEVRRYGELARELGSAARAIGGACRANPIPIIVPCHRVVGQSGWGGYSGETTGDSMAIKRWLLAHEGVR